MVTLITVLNPIYPKTFEKAVFTVLESRPVSSSVYKKISPILEAQVQIMDSVPKLKLQVSLNSHYNLSGFDTYFYC